MTDRYTELVKAAYEAQQAREGDGYVKLTTELTTADDRLASLALDRERIVAALEAMDDAVEAAKEALDAYFAGRDEDADEPTESDDALFEEAADGYQPSLLEQQHLAAAKAQWHARFGDMPQPIEPLPTDEDEYASAKANGAMS